MTPFEYALGLFSVLVGLALADIAQKAHRLVRHARTISWDGRAILATMLVIIVIISLWFAMWNIRERADILVFGFYLTLFLEMMLLFVLAANSLPDDAGQDCDMSAFYEGNSRTFWLSFAAFQLSFAAHWIYFTRFQGSARGWVFVIGPLAAFLLLAFVRKKALHYLLPAVLITAYLVLNWGETFD
jgi:hypothetical protein